MDCSSYAELMLSEAIGVVGEDIMFSSNATPAEDFVYARRIGATINLDDFSHIDFLEKHGGLPEIISCRYNPGGEFRLGNTIMGNPKEAKYGFTKQQLIDGFRKLIGKGVKRFGLHAFLASNTTDASYYPTLAGLLFETAMELNELLGCDVAFINLSGGIGIPYRPEDRPVDIMDVGLGVKAQYERVFANSTIYPKIFTELGRYMTGPIGSLVTRAIHIKDTHKRFIGCDACAGDLMRPAMYNAYHEVTVLGKEKSPADEIVDITGSLCENNDKFAIDRILPRIEIGDYIAIHDTGAHGFAMGYNYNGKLRSKELLLCEDGSVRPIRRAESVLDYFSTLGDYYESFTRMLTRNLISKVELPGKINLAQLPTPIHALKNASKVLGREIYIKRDDMTGLSLGGNKVRKLEYLLHDAIEKGCDIVLTTGAAQSNHAMLTAACCNRLGLDCILVLKRSGVSERKGNQLLNAMLGAQVVFVDEGDYSEGYNGVYAQMEQMVAQLRVEGRKPYLIPVGGSVPLGAVGYVECVAEFMLQCRKSSIHIDRIVCAVGSGGTFAGLMLGASIFNDMIGSEIKVTGIDIANMDFKPTVKELYNETALLLGRDNLHITESDVDIHTCCGEGYALPSPQGLEAMRIMAESEGILLDPVYSGKAFAGMIRLIREGIIKEDEKILFVHTGGTAALFALDFLPTGDRK